MKRRKMDKGATHKNIIELLESELIPWHYRMIYHKAAVFTDEYFSDSTDPAEKLRQSYGKERKDKEVINLSGGYLAMRYWFPDRKQPFLFHRSLPVVIKGNCIVSYDAGYEQAKRSEYMKDWYKDRGTVSRSERRRRGSLVEAHVSHYFATKYPKMFVPPSNKGKYASPAIDDFGLRLPNGQLYLVDVKSKSYEKNGNGVTVARKIHDRVIYLYADWKDDETVLMHGVANGEWLRMIGDDSGYTTHISDNFFWPIQCLLVMLNMSKSGMDYMDYSRQLRDQTKLYITP